MDPIVKMLLDYVAREVLRLADEKLDEARVLIAEQLERVVTLVQLRLAGRASDDAIWEYLREMQGEVHKRPPDTVTRKAVER